MVLLITGQLEMNSTESEMPPTRICLQIPHIMQRSDWDCGLACAKMILNFVHSENVENLAVFSNICQELGFGTSVWTIDLAYLLFQYGIKHQFYTVTLGVDPTYQDMSFYNENFRLDFKTEEERVSQLFANAASRGIKVEKRSISNAEIASHLNRHVPAIVLVDSSILHCEWCSQARPKQECISNCFLLCGRQRRDGYAGHFIVLCGLDVKKQEFLYRNPGTSEELCCCTFDNLDEARRSHGTDEDILFIYS